MHVYYLMFWKDVKIYFQNKNVGIASVKDKMRLRKIKRLEASSKPDLSCTLGMDEGLHGDANGEKPRLLVFQTIIPVGPACAINHPQFK